MVMKRREVSSYAQPVPVVRNPTIQKRNVSEWIDVLRRELNVDSPEESTNAPTIFERDESEPGVFSVDVVWDQWHGVPTNSRTSMISQAYAYSRRATDLSRIHRMRGFTTAEYVEELVRLGLDAAGDMITQTAFDMIARSRSRVLS